LLGSVVVLDDVTDIQKMERMSAWRGVAQRIAHEIKNPLTPIQLSVQRLRRRYLEKLSDDGTFGEATQIILNEVDALKNLVSEFSAFARLPEVQIMPAALNDIILDAANLFRAAHEHVRFELNLEPLPEMNLDPAQIKRALFNLFDNAVAAMDGKGTITVSTLADAERKSYSLVVADEGCGIPEPAYAQLFEPHFSTKAGGTGLGLAIVQRIIADHNGFVRAMKNSPRGTKFWIDFPFTIRVDARRVAVPGIDRIREPEVRPWS
jgi:two-component system nitrogen regulation sensor histidine kinase NtrY